MADINPLALIGKSNIAPDEPGRKAAADLQRGLGMIELQGRNQLANTGLQGANELAKVLAPMGFTSTSDPGFSNVAGDISGGRRSTNLLNTANALGTLQHQTGLGVAPLVNTVEGLMNPKNRLLPGIPGAVEASLKHGQGAIEAKQRDQVVDESIVDARTGKDISLLKKRKTTKEDTRKRKLGGKRLDNSRTLMRQFVTQHPDIEPIGVVMIKGVPHIKTADGRLFKVGK